MVCFEYILDVRALRQVRVWLTSSNVDQILNHKSVVCWSIYIRGVFYKEAREAVPPKNIG